MPDTPMVDPYDIWINPQNPDMLYVASTDRDPYGGIFKSDDGGDTWDHILSKDFGGSPELQLEIERNAGLFGCNAITADPQNSNIMYATAGTVGGSSHGDYKTIYGLLRSTDGGQSWHPFARDIKYGRLSNVVVSPHDSNILYVGSYGAGGFRIDVSQIETKIRQNKAQTIPQNIQLFANYPNPFNPSTMIPYYLPNSAHVTLNVFNINGQLVNTLVDEFQNAGYHSTTFVPALWSSGVYLYQLTADDFSVVKSMSFAR
jgi:hypothetical protein